MQVTWWELEELLEHMRACASHARMMNAETNNPDRQLCPGFEELKKNMWLRLHREHDTPWYGIAILMPPILRKYTCATIQTSLIDLDKPDIDLEWIVMNFTSYNIRLRITEALMEELKLDQRTASLMGVGLSHIALVSESPTNEDTGELAESNAVGVVQSRKRLCVTPGGGWTELRRVGPGHVRARVALRGLGTSRNLSYLVGVLHPNHGGAESLDNLFRTQITSAYEAAFMDEDSEEDPPLPLECEVKQ